jgi:uncharacterized protein (DUF362 family)
MEKINRREFLKRFGALTVATAGLGIAADDLLDTLEQAEAATRPTIAVASGSSIEAMVKKAVDGIGGIEKFVRKGASVVIKPNIAWARTPEQAANTNPHVVKALINLCKRAGASRITVLDHTCDSPTASFKLSGIKDIVEGTGARLISVDKEFMFKKISIPKGKLLKSDECAREVLDADVFINVPIAKVHGSARITASMKNLMGTNFDRQRWHRLGLDQCIADYATAVKADLIVLDAVRILLTNGPKGPGRTKDVGQVIAGTDPVAIDAYAAKLLGVNVSEVEYISLAAQHGLGQKDLSRVNIKRV